jgi:pimeloyl-ACP methyl ester carboxylesterase
MPSLFDDDAFNGSLFFPRREHTIPPPGARDLYVSVEGAHLHVRLHEGEGLSVLTLFFHGNGETVSDYDGLARHYASHAQSALAVVDYRGYGLSTGRPTLRRALADALPVLEAVRAEAAGRPLVVMGRSLGGACAAELCRREHEGVVGYVFESAAADLRGVVRRRGLAPPAALTPDEADTFDPLPKLARCTRPALVLHGEDDSLIAVSEAEQSFEALANCPRTLVRVPGRGHNDLSLHPSYWQALGRFYAGLREAP